MAAKMWTDNTFSLWGASPDFPPFPLVCVHIPERSRR